MKEFQLDLFGGETPVEEAYDPHAKETSMMRFRRINGYNARHRCVNCEYRNGNKCTWGGLTITPDEIACMKWKHA